MSETAFRSSAPEVVRAWDDFIAARLEIFNLREELSEALGRRIYVNKGSGFGSTRIVGFERLEGDKDGDLISDGCLVVSSERGHHHGLVVPNLRRKAGKEYAAELELYTNPGLELPGMTTFHIYSSGHGMVVGGPGLFRLRRTLYAYWDTDTIQPDDRWKPIRLSEYHKAKEQFEEEQA